MKRFLFALWIAGLLSLLPAPVCAQETAAEPEKAALDPSKPHEVSFHRPWARGDHYELEVSLDFYMFQKMGKGQDIDLGTGEEKSFITLKGSVRIIKVNEFGEATWRAVKITEAKETSEEKTEALSIEGADLGISFQNDKMNFQRKDGEEIPPEEKMLLSMLFSSPSGMNKDDYLAPPGPVKIGDTWKGNSEVYAKLMAGDADGEEGEKGEEKEGPAIKAENIDLKLTLKGIEDFEEIPCYRLLEERLIHNMEIPRFTGEYFIDVKNERWMPVDSNLKKSKIVQTYQQKMKGKQSDPQTNYIDIWSDVKMTTTIIYR